MKRQGTGRVLHFAVTGALLGSVGVGCGPKHGGPYTNTGPVDGPPPGDDVHVNPGPDEDPGAAEDGDEPAPAPDHVNTAPVEEPGTPPTGTVIVNTVQQPEPQPEPQPDHGPSTMNVRKVADEPPPAKPTVKHVNTAKTPDPKPASKKQ